RHRGPGADHAAAGELVRPAGRRDRRPATIDRGAQRGIAGGGLLVLRLLCGRLCGQAAGTAVVGDPVARVVDDGAVVDVGDVYPAEIVHAAVVGELAVVPVAALVADTAIAVTVV